MRASLVQLSVGTVGLVLLTGCGTKSPTAGGSASSVQPGSGTWKDYFVVRDGRSCVASAKLALGSRTVTSTATSTVSDVDSSPTGLRFAVNVNTKTSGADPSTPIPEQHLRLPYLIAPDGTLSAKPSMQQQGAFRYEMDGFEVYPSLPDLRAGKQRRSTIKVRLLAANAASRAAFKPGLKPGETDPELMMTFVIGPAPKKQKIVTPAGTFTDVVGATVNAESIKFDNLLPDAAKAADSSLGALTSQLKTVTYFARRVGVVQTTVAGTTVSIERCTG